MECHKGSTSAVRYLFPKKIGGARNLFVESPHVFQEKHQNLVGGFSPTQLKNMSQIGSFPQGSGWKLKKIETTT